MYHTCNGLGMLPYVSVLVQLAQTGKANVATHHKWYQLLMVHSLLDHGLTFVYQMAMLPFSCMNGTRREINLNSSAFRPESSGGILSHNCKLLAFACSGMEPLTKDLSPRLFSRAFVNF